MNQSMVDALLMRRALRLYQIYRDAFMIPSGEHAFTPREAWRAAWRVARRNALL